MNHRCHGEHKKTGPSGPVFIGGTASFGLDGHTRDAVPIAIAFACL